MINLGDLYFSAGLIIVIINIILNCIILGYKLAVDKYDRFHTKSDDFIDFILFRCLLFSFVLFIAWSPILIGLIIASIAFTITHFVLNKKQNKNF